MGLVLDYWQIELYPRVCVEGLEISPYAEKEAGLVTWLKAPYCLPIPTFLIACDPVS